MPRSPRSSSDDSDSDSSYSSSSSRNSRSSRDSKRSTQTSVSRTAIRDDNWAIKLMKVAAGAPQRPCTVRRTIFQVPYESVGEDEDELAYREYIRYSWELAKFDDSISEILSRRERQGSRQSTSSKNSRRRRTEKFVQQPVFEQRFEEADYDRSFEHPAYDPGFFPVPPTQTPHPQWQPAPPPPPPPANFGGGGNPAPFINLNGPIQGNFREGWD